MTESPPSQEAEQSRRGRPKAKKSETGRAEKESHDQTDQYDRVGSDELRALVAGGLVASLFVYLALRDQIIALAIETNTTAGPPFVFPEHDPLGLGTALIWGFDIQIVLYAIYLVLLAVSYSMDNPDFAGRRWLDHEALAKGIRLWADRFFFVGSLGMVIFGILVVTRIVEYLATGGPL